MKTSANPPSATAAADPHRDEMTFTTTPNLLTLSRMVITPVVVGVLSLKEPGWDLVAALLFGVAGFTDYLDGYIARVQKSVSVYGKLMDPLADKFLVVSALIMLQALGRIHPYINILLICRELAITGLRALASAEGVVIAASGSGKWKTAFQMTAIPFLMVKQGLFGVPLFEIGTWLLYFSLAISLWSAQDYVVDFFRALRESRKQKHHHRRMAREARIAARELRLEARAKRGRTPPPET